MQPYQAGYGIHSFGDVSYYPFEPAYLWILHELSNVDKHRTIFLFRFRAKESAEFYRAMAARSLLPIPFQSMNL